jgi:hypothetical protein
MPDRFEREIGHVGDKRNPETKSGRGNPTVGVVLALGKCMADRFAACSELSDRALHLRDVSTHPADPAVTNPRRRKATPDTPLPLPTTVRSAFAY